MRAISPTWIGLRVVGSCFFVVLASALATAAPPISGGGPTDRLPEAGWARHQTQWRLPGGARIRALHEAPGAPVPKREHARPVRPALTKKKIAAAQAPPFMANVQTSTEVSAYVVHSPPVDGFVPWIAVLATDKHKTSDYWDADPSTSVLGNYLIPNPQTAYGIGLLDTGAGISVMGHAVADQLGLFPSFNTGLTIAIGGVTGTIDAWVSQPFGLWITGLGNIDPVTQAVNTASMVGQWNVSAALGIEPDPGMPDMPTAIGSPLAVYFASWIRNDLWHSINRGGTTYEAPDITFHLPTSPALPVYPNKVPLQLRPTGASDTWFWPCFASLEYCPGGDGSPQIPTVIMGTTAQSLFFASSVNLSDRGYVASSKPNFMVDTGAQVTVISSAVAAQLGMNPNTPDFIVEVQGVDGQVAYEPGFFVDTLDIPALGEWLSYTQVPVVMLDVDSPEGGVLDGIIGMNLFLRYNILLRGGGLPNMNQPSLEFAPLPSINADYDGDNDVDMEDFAYLQVCISGKDVEQTDPDCAYVFLDGDLDIDEQDVRLFTYCASGPNIPASPECLGQ